MIQHPAFLVDPWALREVELDLERLAQAESVFALANGHIGLRGNLDEGEPYGLLGTYLAGLYEIRPLPYAEAGYGYPEAGQTVVNATDGKIVRLRVEDEPFDIRYGELRGHERVLGLHIASLARAWIAAVAGFGGMRDHDGSLRFTPRRPNALTRLTFRLCFRGRRLLIEVRPKHATCSLRPGAPLEIFHHGEHATLAARDPLTRPIPPVLARETPKQPPGAGADRARIRRAPERHQTNGGIVNAATVSERAS